MPTLRRLWARPLAATVVVALLPFLLLAVRALADHAASPSGDVALIEVRVGDVGPRTPLLGSYGRFGFNHPGPLLFYVLAGPYRLLGSHYAVAAVLRVSIRRGGRLGLVWVASLLAGLAGTGSRAASTDPPAVHVAGPAVERRSGGGLGRRLRHLNAEVFQSGDHR